MHTNKNVNLLANQEIEFAGYTTNIHDIESIQIEDDRIIDIYAGNEFKKGWFTE